MRGRAAKRQGGRVEPNAGKPPGRTGKGTCGNESGKTEENDEGKRREKDVFLRRMGVVLPLIEYVVKADILLDMLALIFTGFNDSAENVLLRCLLAPE